MICISVKFETNMYLSMHGRDIVISNRMLSILLRSNNDSRTLNLIILKCVVEDYRINLMTAFRKIVGNLLKRNRVEENLVF